MARTLISLDDRAKAWLASQAKARRVPMAEIVRQAVDRLRAEQERTEALLDGIRRTSGLWKRGDGLAWQQQLRDEWQDRA
jgi:hypothetical protein